MRNLTKSTVTIVGAGPGDPDLITLKGLKAIQSADVILYDALSNEDLLAYAREGTEKIYVGKRCGRHSLKQADINALLISKSKTSQNIVRLKGGDPFIFGRGHEEYTALQSLGISVKIVPGISSSTSLPLLQKVPLTRRNISESFWVLTGTTKDHEISRDVYDASKSNATVVILMGIKKISQITKIFIEQGKGNVPVMIISKGSQKDEEIVLGSVSDIHQRAMSTSFATPGIIVIGEVVSLHPQFINQVKTLTYEHHS